ncbi:MAG: hypothetical protein KGL53_09500 [Elusimicrobia bacterium]|nr:hypothetical protein [Elusimicrobiota bacterium]
MSRALLLAGLLLAPARARAFPWWTDSLDSAWASAPVAMDAKDEAWFGGPELDESQVVVRARNDAKTLTLLLVAEGLDGRALWSGAYRQDATLWFMDSRGKKKAWGVRLPYSRLPGRLPDKFLTDDAYPSSPSLAPEWVDVSGSTSALPSDVATATGGSGKNPVLELSVPLSRLQLGEGGTVTLRIESERVSREVRRFYQKRPPPPARRGRRYEAMPDEGPAPLYPAPLSLRVRVRLAARPAHS